MPWFSVEDNLPLHPKVTAAGNSAMGLWVRAGAWAMHQLTDGFVPDEIARTLGSAADARRLVKAGLWLETDGGFLFHDWLSRQRSKAQVEAEREAGRKRKERLLARARDAKGGENW
jgi:hypothetical protein